MSDARAIKNLLAACLGAGAIFLVLEAGLRLAPEGKGGAGPPAPNAFNVPINRRDPELFWSLEPGARYGNITVNARGHRGPDFPEEKAPGTVRIITMGDSCTLGVGVAEDQTYGRVLERLLNTPAGPARYEVINAGVPGYTSLQALRQLERDLRRYRPDAVTLYFGLNDYLFAAGGADKDIRAGRGGIVRRGDLMERSRLWRFIRGRFSSLGAPRAPYPPPRRVGPDDFRANLTKMVGTARAAGIRVFLLNIPLRPDVPLVVNAVPIPGEGANGEKYVAGWLRPAYLGKGDYYVRKEFDGSAEELREALKKHPRWAIARYFLGLKYLEAGEKGKAEEEFRLAREMDEDRAVVAEYNGIIREVAAAEGVPLVDLDRAFERRKAADLFLDERHPNPQGYEVVARELLAALTDAGIR